MKKNVFIGVVLLGIVAVVNAGVVYEEDFDGLTPGTYLSPEWNLTATSGTEYVVEADTGDLFGAGASNQILKITASGAGVNNSIGYWDLPDGPVVTFSFDLIQPNNSDDGAVSKFYLSGYDSSVANIQHSIIKLDTGNVLNNAGTTVATYGSALTHVDFELNSISDTYQIFINGALVDSGAAKNLTDTITRFKLTSNKTTVDTYIDNIALTVPEPATMILLGLGSLAALKKRK